jgi:hypothetical protein
MHPRNGRLFALACNDYVSVVNATTEARSQRGQIRFAVPQSIWADSLTLEGAIAEISSQVPPSRGRS